MMREFFRSWRRKAGCVALLFAFALFGLWMRSRVVLDVVRFEADNRQQSILSLNGDLWAHPTIWGGSPVQ